MADLKPGWKRMKFGELAECVNDRVDDPSMAGVDRYVGLEHLDSENLKIRRWGTPEQVESTKLRFKSGDIIFGKRRAYQRKLAVADFEGICSAHAMVLRAKPRAVLPEFLPFFMQSDPFMERAVAISVGSLSPTINWKTLAVEEFALPSLEDQRRACTLLLAAERALDASCVAAAASDVLLRSLVDDLVKDAFLRGDVQELDGLIHPDRPVTYGILMPGTGFPGGVPVVKVRDYPNGFIEANDLLLTDPKIDAAYSRSRLRAGDLLISIRGTVGRLAFVPSSLDGANITQDSARLSVTSAVNPLFLKAVLGSSPLRRQIRTHTTGLAVQGLNIGALRKLRLPIVSRRDQDAAAETILRSEQAVIRVRGRLEEARLFKLECLKHAVQEGG